MAQKYLYFKSLKGLRGGSKSIISYSLIFRFAVNVLLEQIVP